MGGESLKESDIGRKMDRKKGEGQREIGMENERFFVQIFLFLSLSLFYNFNYSILPLSSSINLSKFEIENTFVSSYDILFSLSLLLSFLLRCPLF